MNQSRKKTLNFSPGDLVRLPAWIHVSGVPKESLGVVVDIVCGNSKKSYFGTQASVVWSGASSPMLVSIYSLLLV